MVDIPFGYSEFCPSAPLRDFVDCFWTYDIDVRSLTAPRRPVIPDACIDIIWDLGSAGRDCELIGPMTLPFYNRSRRLFGLRFKAFSASFFLGFPLSEIQDQKVNCLDLPGGINWGSLIRPGMKLSAAVSALESVLMDIIPGIQPQALRAARALNLLEKESCSLSVQSIGDKIGWSRQHLARKCRDLSGLSPKFICQVFRLQRTIDDFQEDSDFAFLANSHGYCDQSHMIHDFKKLTSLSPSVFFSL